MDKETAEALRRDTTIDLTTIGRRSGKRRRIEIWMLKIGDRIFITGTPGRRDWYANLHANPTCTVHLKQKVKADVRATALVVKDRETRTRVLEHLEATWYREQGEGLETLLNEAPMVELKIEGWPA
ncbi:MAG: nitroreductase family deazaflavin-dependent oxidoreductase [Acidimicrobiales bacterium]